MKEGWEIKKLTDVLWFQEGPGVRKHQYTTSGVKLLNVANLVNGKVDLSTSDRYISEEEAYGKYKHFLADEGDLILASSGIQVEYIEKKMGFITKEHLPLCMNTSTIRFKSLDKGVLDIAFFMYFLKSFHFKEQLSKLITGIAQLNFGPSHLKQMTIPVPSLPEQERIVAELDCLSSVIEKQKQQLKELDNLAQAIFYDMFGDPITNEKGWEIKTLAEVCDVRDGTHDSPKYLEESDYVLITSKNITSDGEIDFSTANYISREDYDAINKRSYVDFGDIIMAMIGTIGKPIIVKKTDRKFCIKNVALIKFSTSTVVLNTYIQSLLSSSVYEEYIHSQNKGGTQKFIALGTIRKLPIPTPSLSLQQEFASKIEAIEKQKELIKQSLSETETLFNSRMDYYFN